MMHRLAQVLRHLPALCLVAMLTLAAVPAVQAAPANGTAVEDLEKLVQTLENEPRRAELVTQLKALIAAEKKKAGEQRPGGFGARLLETLSERIEHLSEQIADTALAVSDFPRLVDWVAVQVQSEAARDRWASMFGKLLAILAAGLAAEFIAGRLLARPRRALEVRTELTLWMRSPLAVGRGLLDLVPLAAFTAAGWGALTLLKMTGDGRIAALMIVTAYVLASGLAVLARALLMPHNSLMRLLPVGDETAEYVLIWVRRLGNIAIFGYFVAEAARLLGLPRGSYQFSLKMLGVVVATMMVVFILQNRQAVAGWIRACGEARAEGLRIAMIRNRLADLWHVLAILYIVVGCGIWVLQIKGGFEYMAHASALTVIILLVSALVQTAIRRLLDRSFQISDELKRTYPKLEARANRYLAIMHVVLRGTVVLVTVLALAQAWGVDTVDWAASATGRRVIGSLFTIALVLTVAVLVWEVVSSATERYLSATDGDGKTVERSARARTLLPLLRNALLVVLLIMVIMVVLAELGVNIAPLLAGAGVVGLAIGFGSQKLVQDVITGIFILFENTISVGDVVKVEAHSGVVEGLSIRSLRLRDMSGSVYTIPFSSVGTVVNLTKDFSFYVLDVGVSYREDTDHVVEVLKELGAELQQDETLGPDILEPLEVLGVDRFADSAVIIKARLKTRPLRQWVVGREFNRRMKKRFDQIGIEIPFPHRTVYFGEDKSGRAPPLRVRSDLAPAET